MPDAPRPSIAFPAFQTPGNLGTQAVREHQSDYAMAQGSARELSRRTDGYWLDLPYAPSTYTADVGLWQVQPKQVLAQRYKLVGAEMHWSFFLLGLVTAPTQRLYLALPERLRARQSVTHGGVAGLSGGLTFLALTQIDRGQRKLGIFYDQLGNWPAQDMQVRGQIVIEVEEV